MRILLKSSFVDRLENQVIYIAKDSPSRARKFNMDVLKEVKNIHPNPYRFRKSTYFEDNTIRDLIFNKPHLTNVTPPSLKTSTVRPQKLTSANTYQTYTPAPCIWLRQTPSQPESGSSVSNIRPPQRSKISKEIKSGIDIKKTNNIPKIAPTQ